MAQLQVGAGATRYRTALGRAAEALGDRPGRIVVITDLQQSGWDAADQGAVPERIPVEIEDIGGPDGNVAITALRVEGTEAIAFVQNFARRPVAEQVTFAIDGQPIGTVPVTIVAGGSADARLTVPDAAAGAFSVAVSDSEGYAGDNARFALIDADGGAAGPRRHSLGPSVRVVLPRPGAGYRARAPAGSGSGPSAVLRFPI